MNISQMILHITGEVISIVIMDLLQELSENNLCWFLENAVKSIQSSSMRHSYLNIFDSHLSCRLHQLS